MKAEVVNSTAHFEVENPTCVCSYCFVTDIFGVEKVLIDETRPPYVLLSLLNIFNYKFRSC